MPIIKTWNIKLSTVMRFSHSEFEQKWHSMDRYLQMNANQKNEVPEGWVIDKAFAAASLIALYGLFSSFNKNGI